MEKTIRSIVYEKAFEEFGKMRQIDKAIEEFAELIQALSKYKAEQNNLHSVLEELADAFIMIEQMIQLFNFGRNLESMIEFKICRLERKITKNETVQE